jgi:hypothetical protein
MGKWTVSASPSDKVVARFTPRSSYPRLPAPAVAAGRIAPDLSTVAVRRPLNQQLHGTCLPSSCFASSHGGDEAIRFLAGRDPRKMPYLNL